MRTSYIIISFLFLCTVFIDVNAQQQSNFDPDVDQPKKWLIHTGLAYQFWSHTGSLAFMGLERPITHYHQIGLEASIFIPQYTGYNGEYEVLRGSFELGATFKYFLHGRFSGRKSGYYFGTDMRWGRKELQFLVYEPSAGNSGERYTENVAKMMLRTGRQKPIGRALIEWALPIGFERVDRSPADPTRSTNSLRFILAPSLSLGIAL